MGRALSAEHDGQLKATIRPHDEGNACAGLTRCSGLRMKPHESRELIGDGCADPSD